MKQTLTGTVVKKSGDKTVAVLVVRKRQHPKYGKTVSSSKKYLVHDPLNAAKADDVVIIQETRPLSRKKRWVIVDQEKRKQKKEI